VGQRRSDKPGRQSSSEWKESRCQPGPVANLIVPADAPVAAMSDRELALLDARLEYLMREKPELAAPCTPIGRNIMRILSDSDHSRIHQ